MRCRRPWVMWPVIHEPTTPGRTVSYHADQPQHFPRGGRGGKGWTGLAQIAQYVNCLAVISSKVDGSGGPARTAWNGASGRVKHVVSLKKSGNIPVPGLVPVQGSRYQCFGSGSTRESGVGVDGAALALASRSIFVSSGSQAGT